MPFGYDLDIKMHNEILLFQLVWALNEAEGFDIRN